ncbi:hypothetical protein BN2476_110091 [Paraburkholderia piptadeniae]|uniref:Uncharacterized protein n=1 Tax=Paraburkholderia piptadeniae TaxID=1701573 RepID=A0A1N7RPM4_9BURK|nr:hypothetical protein BN2476_110091 [Paraburkholderia piptadeniae]
MPDRPLLRLHRCIGLRGSAICLVACIGLDLRGPRLDSVRLLAHLVCLGLRMRDGNLLDAGFTRCLAGRRLRRAGLCFGACLQVSLACLSRRRHRGRRCGCCSLCESRRNEQGGSQSSEHRLHVILHFFAPEKVRRWSYNATSTTWVDAEEFFRRRARDARGHVAALRRGKAVRRERRGAALSLPERLADGYTTRGAAGEKKWLFLNMTAEHFTTEGDVKRGERTMTSGSIRSRYDVLATRRLGFGLCDDCTRQRARFSGHHGSLACAALCLRSQGVSTFASHKNA